MRRAPSADAFLQSDHLLLSETGGYLELERQAVGQVNQFASRPLTDTGMARRGPFSTTLP